MDEDKQQALRKQTSSVGALQSSPVFAFDPAKPRAQMTGYSWVAPPEAPQRTAALINEMRAKLEKQILADFNAVFQTEPARKQPPLKVDSLKGFTNRSNQPLSGKTSSHAIIDDDFMQFVPPPIARNPDGTIPVPISEVDQVLLGVRAAAKTRIREPGERFPDEVLAEEVYRLRARLEAAGLPTS